MLTIEQWNELHPDKFSYCSFKNSCLWPGDRIIAEGMLKFTDETAHCWAGPFEGGYAHCVVRDYTNSTYAGGPKKGKNYLKCLDEYYKNLKAEVARDISGKKKYYEPNDMPSLEKPIRIWMLGNDDTSYSKFYRTEKEAMDELNLFIANQPLDFHEVIEDFNFIFTN